MPKPLDDESAAHRPAAGHDGVGRPGPERPGTGRSADGSPSADNGEKKDPPPAEPEEETPKPKTMDDELRALNDHGEDSDELRETILANLLADQVTARLRDGSRGVRIQQLQMFNGDFSVGTGFNFNASGRGSAGGIAGLRPVDVKRLAAQVETFLRPPLFDKALQILWQHRILVLAIRQGSGRQTTALNLLAEVLAMGGDAGDGAGLCYYVTNIAAIADTDWKPGAKGSGYLLLLEGNATNAELAADVIDEHWLAVKADQLTDTQSFMVVVTEAPRGALVEAAAHGSHVITSLGTIDPLRIVERHALGAGPGLRERSELFHRLTVSGAEALLKERPEPQIAVRVATAIREKEDLEQTVRELRDPTAQVHTWFNQNRGTETLSMAIAAAVLDGGSYLEFSDAAVTLYERLAGGAGAPPDLRLWEQLTAGHPWIEVVFDEHASAPPRVRLRNPLVQQAVLRYMWTYLDGCRSAILGWLGDLVTNPDVGVRARAAVAAGVIAWHDQNHAVHRYLRPWSGGESLSLRQSAATALAVMGAEPDLTESTWRLLDSWVADGERRDTRLCTTAVRAVGGNLGGDEPERALTLIRTTLDRESWAPVLPATLSVARLVELGRVREVLRALLDWTKPQDSSPMVVKSLGIFVTVACQPPAEIGGGLGGGTPSGAVRPPLLMAHAREHLRELAELWARALARKPAQSYALDCLRECLSAYAEHDRTALRGITAVLLEVAARPGRHRDRLDWYLDQWARDADEPSASAAYIRDALLRPG